MQLITSTKILIILSAWTASTEAYKCALPAETFNFALITKNNAAVGAHAIYLGVAVGGTLSDTTSNESGTVDKTKSYVGSLSSNARFNFNGGISQNAALSSIVDFSHYEWLARNAVSSNAGGKKVIVVDHGGTFNMYDFNSGGQGSDDGNTLIIFDTDEDITLDKTSDGRQFGPSVIAPFAKVSLKGRAGYIDGIVVAKEFKTTSSNQGQLQLHGKAYTGALECPGTAEGSGAAEGSALRVGEGDDGAAEASAESAEEGDEGHLCNM
jgi:hypothetical protein